MGQNNQKDQKGPKMTAAVMLVQNNQNNQKIWSLHISLKILKVRFFWDTLYVLFLGRRRIFKQLSQLLVLLFQRDGSSIYFNLKYERQRFPF